MTHEKGGNNECVCVNMQRPSSSVRITSLDHQRHLNILKRMYASPSATDVGGLTTNGTVTERERVERAGEEWVGVMAVARRLQCKYNATEKKKAHVNER